MDQAIGEVVAFGVGVALSPLAVVAVVVMLVSPAGRLSAWVFSAAWVLALVIATTGVVLVADGADSGADQGAAPWVITAKIVLAVLFVAVAIREWRSGSGDPDDHGSPAWLARLETAGSLGAASLGVAFAVVKPKNLLLTLGAGLAIAQTDSSPRAQVAAVAVFVILASAGVIAPLAVALCMPSRGHAVLLRLRDWLVRENATVIAVICLIIAAKLFGDAIASLAR